MTEKELQEIRSFTCTKSYCASRNMCRIKNGELLTIQELNVRLKIDEGNFYKFWPIDDCSTQEEAVSKAMKFLKEQEIKCADIYIDDKKIATIYG